MFNICFIYIQEYKSETFNLFNYLCIKYFGQQRKDIIPKIKLIKIKQGKKY